MKNVRSSDLKDTYLGQKVQDQLVKNEQVLGGPRRRGGLAGAAGPKSSPLAPRRP